MASTPEVKVKKVVIKHLKDMGAYYFYPVTGGYGGSGVPDIVGCHKGHKLRRGHSTSNQRSQHARHNGTGVG